MLVPKPEVAIAPVQSVPLASVAPATPPQPSLRENLGDEIFEIFTEEVAEICENLVNWYPEWQHNLKNTNLLTDIRRAFHTLKGSSRMAGALALGDLGWAHENLLNQVMSGRFEATDRIVKQIGKALDEVNQRQAFYIEAIVKDARTEALIKSAEAILNDEPEPSETPISHASVLPELNASSTINTESFADVEDSEIDFAVEDDMSLPVEAEDSLNWDVIEVAPSTTSLAIASQSADNAISFALLDDLELTTMDAAVNVATPAPIASPELNFADLELVDVDFAPVSEPAMSEASVIEQAKAATIVAPAHSVDSSHLFDLTDDDAVDFATETETTLSSYDTTQDELALPDFLTEDTSTTETPSEVDVETETSAAFASEDLLFEPINSSKKLPASTDEFAIEDEVDFADSLDFSDSTLAPLPSDSIDTVNRQQPPEPQAFAELVDFDLLADDLDQTDLAATQAVLAEAEELDFAQPLAALSSSLPEFDSPELSEFELHDTSELAPAEFELPEPIIAESVAFAVEPPVSVDFVSDDTDEALSFTEPAPSLEQASNELWAIAEDDSSLDFALAPANFDFADESTGFIEAIAADEPETALVEVAAPKPVSSTAPVITAPVDAETQLVWQLFWEEFPEQLQALETNMQALRANPHDRDVIRELEREFHTLKGGARMAQVFSIADVSHAAESLLAQLPLSGAPDASVLEKVQASIDQIHALSEHSQTAPARVETAPTPSPTPIPTAPPSTNSTSMWAGLDKAGSLLERMLAEQADSLPDIAILDNSSATNPSNPALITDTLTSQSTNPQETIRMPAAFVDRLIEQVVGLNVQKIRVFEQMSRMGIDVEELGRTVTRLRQQVRLLELESEAQIHAGQAAGLSAQATADGFDPLEMDQYAEIQRISRSLAESLNDLVNLEADLSQQLDKSEQLLQNDMRMIRQVQQDLLDTRLVAVSVLTPRLRRLARQTGAELGKQVNLEVEGEECELDRHLLQHMTTAMEHLIRNSVSHGIELPEEREKVGKSPLGNIQLSVSRDEAEIVIRYRDDGRGLNPAKLRKRGIEMGLLLEGQDVPDSELYRLILRPGFSTADSLSQIAGRGIGMDVVYSEVKSLGGSLQIDSKLGEGVEFNMRLPFTMVVNPVLLIDVENQVFAMPMTGIQGVTRISGKDLKAALAVKDSRVEFAGQRYQLNHLGHFLINNPLSEWEDEDMIPVVLVDLHKQTFAWAVDKIRGQREVVLQPLGVLFKGCRLYSAATVTPDGNVYLVPDMADLARQLTQPQISAKAQPEKNTVIDHHAPRILVVDDSVTVRRVTEKFLASQNYIVGTAKDGMDALEQVGDFQPDVVLLDIEMPRMDGFELLGHLRHDGAWKDLPVIMISSRTAAKHKDHAMSLGATDFLGKPYQNEILLSTIQQVLLAKSKPLEMLTLGETISASPAVPRVPSLSMPMSSAPPAEDKAVRVLVIDDSVTVRRVTEKFLVSQKYVVETAKDGIDALEKIGEFKPDIALSDIEMPRMDGFELLAQLRAQEQWKKLPIVMISSRTAPKHREHAESLGATDFLGKPYQNDVLLETLQTVLQQQKATEAV
jgi:chemosensory pili system protein ChpA (sensor histidine kinase/response regulator)